MLITNLLKTFSQEELGKVRQNFSLPERSRMLFERIVTSPSLPPDTKQLTKAFHISKENLYRLYSEIVDECVRILAPKEEFATMKFYGSKYLYRPFISEFRRCEKEYIRTNKLDKLEEFYQYSFIASMGFPVSDIDFDILEQIGMKWHRATKAPAIDNELFIMLRIAFTKIGALPSKKKLTLAQQEIAAEAILAPLREKAKKSKNPKALHAFYQAEWISCIFKGITHRRVEFLQKSLEVVKSNRSWFTDPEQEKIIEQQIAMEFASTGQNLKQSLEIFRKYYNGQKSDNSRGAIFLTRFMKIAFLAKEFDLAWEILNQYESSSAAQAMPTVHIVGILVRIRLEIITEKLEGAAKSIEIARKELKQSFFLAYELPLRALETLLMFKKGDFNEAEQLVERNVKWLRSRKVALDTSSWIYFYKIIAGIITHKMTGQFLRAPLINHFNKEFKIEYPEFFMLIDPELPRQ